MLRLRVEVTDFPLQFFVKPHLVDVVLQNKTVVLQFGQTCKVFIKKCDRFLNVITTPLVSRYTNADLKISLYVRVCIKIIP